MKDRITVIIFFTIALFCQYQAGFAQSLSSEWNQWRGGEKQGISSSQNIPTQWSNGTNVQWKTSLPGLGHSSPVVSRNNVIVTSAQFTLKYKKLFNALNIILLGISLILVFYFIKNLRLRIANNLESPVFQIINSSATAFLFGLIIFFALSGFLFKTPEKPDHVTSTYRWFYSGISVMANFILILNLLAKRRFTYLILSLLLIIFTFLLFYVRPYPEYYPLKGDGFMMETMIKTLKVSAIAFVSLILSMVFKSKLKHQKWILSNLHLILIWSITLLSFIAGIFGISIYRYILYSLPEGDFVFPKPNLYYRDTYIYFRLIIFGMIIWFISYLIIPNPKNERYTKWHQLALILFAGLFFINKNFIQEQRTYVRTVICINRVNGEIKWIKELFKGDQPSIHLDNSAATPTPIIHNDTIYAYFGSPGFACLNIKGDVLWTNKNIHFTGIHGIGSSPVYKNGLVVIVNDMSDSAYITALDAKTGNQVWTNEREPQGGTICGYRTPTIYKFNNTESIVTWGKDKLTIYDLNTGAQLYSLFLKSSRQELSASIIYSGDTIFAFDFQNLHALHFPSLLSEKYPYLWSKNAHRGGPQDASPTFYNNMLFMISDNGTASCINAKTGDVIWRKRLDGIFMSSCVVVDDKIYLTNTSGETTVLSASKNFEIINKNSINETVYASLVPIDNQLFIRSTQHLYCISK